VTRTQSEVTLRTWVIWREGKVVLVRVTRCDLTGLTKRYERTFDG